ncbi:fluoride efflux transporter CrcB [Oceanobacillus halotolerans]|uniref:fluoride efflux transporter CrcB n=1 Tax=Oceanobacillus halotolerans TaxID=2663380 RepID=UPI0013DADB90|nr:fluoride efflux transporter CrcB [Oceanobacillus halotolerans]
MTQKAYILIGIGGMIGAIGRYSLSLLFANAAIFPYGTIVANLIGCFLLSLLLNHPTIKQKLSPELFMALGTGVIGSFTTFSTFSVETIQLWDTSELLAIAYVLISVIAGLLFSLLGYTLANRKRF